MTDKVKQPQPKKKSSQLSNSKPRGSSSKLIFGNAELCSQFLRNYMDMPILKNVRAEDIEDVSERYVPMFTEERNSDTVKRIKLSENNTLFFVSLIEHKTKVDYNMSMQLLRYMVYIWEDYEKEMERQHKGITKTKGWKKGIKKGVKEGLEQGLERGLEQGRTEGEARLAKLSQTLIQEKRMDDLTKALADSTYRKELYQQHNI